MKARTVCIPLTSVNLRSVRYSASAIEEGSVTTDGQNGTRVPSSGSSTTIDPVHGSATTSTPPSLTLRLVQILSTMQSTTTTRPSSASRIFCTSPWSFSHAKSSGCSSRGTRGSAFRVGTTTPLIAPPKEQEKVVARETSGWSSSAESSVKTSDLGGMYSGVPSSSWIMSTLFTVSSSFTLNSHCSGFADTTWPKKFSQSGLRRRSRFHWGVERWTMVNAMPEADTAGTTRPMPNLPAPKCMWKRDPSSSGPLLQHRSLRIESSASGPRTRLIASSGTSQTSSLSHCWQSAIVMRSPVVMRKKFSEDCGSDSTRAASAGPRVDSSSLSSMMWHSSICPFSPMWHTSKLRSSGCPRPRMLTHGAARGLQWAAPKPGPRPWLARVPKGS
mmetsp:Transcript_71272/g.158430  ORF Transcript_71272/g.158430 Transcript_71272/m.158430 type:complete len:387 (-) Transcript_71272:32-1192(-)